MMHCTFHRLVLVGLSLALATAAPGCGNPYGDDDDTTGDVDDATGEWAFVSTPPVQDPVSGLVLPVRIVASLNGSENRSTYRSVYRSI